MSNFVEKMQLFDFTQYEAQTMDILVRYHHLTPSKLAKLSNVPQPKIYETINRLEIRGFVDIIAEGKKKIIQIKPKQIVKEKLHKKFQDFQNTFLHLNDEIDSIFISQEISPLPIVGVSGYTNIEEQFIRLIENAQNEISGILPKYLFTQSVIKAINDKEEDFQMKIIFNKKEDLENINISDVIAKNVQFYYVNPQDRSFFENVQKKIPQFLPPEAKKSFSFQLFLSVIEKLNNHLGLIVADNKQSLFIIPIPIETPLAVISNLPDMVNFHVESMETVKKSAVLITKKTNSLS